MYVSDRNLLPIVGESFAVYLMCIIFCNSTPTLILDKSLIPKEKGLSVLWEITFLIQRYNLGFYNWMEKLYIFFIFLLEKKFNCLIRRLLQAIYLGNFIRKIALKKLQ